MPLLVVVAELPEGEELHERSSRIKQFNFAKKVLDAAMSDSLIEVDGLVSQGLFVFRDDQGNYRLSLVYGKPEGTKLIWSEVKRQSFYVEAGSPNKTFRDRSAMPWSTFEKLQEAFSVEKLTKEFYNSLFKWYQWALSDDVGVTYPNDTERDEDDRDIGEHLIRLITRLMFVWFLKQKHLVPSEIFDPAALKGILKDFNPESGDNYYRAILQNLFFATLNSEISERAFAVDAGNITENKEHFDIKTLYRYGGEFVIPEKKVLALFNGIPFLNGGLFECLDRGRDYFDGFSRNKRQQAKVPNVLFFDEKDGLIPLLNQYNFTVEENSPGDEEVALDPELLGKVFENLLGAYNPETDVAARKATGSFYTPREIVNYMVDESLKAYLSQKVGQTFLSAQNVIAQTGMSASPSLDSQTGMSAPPSIKNSSLSITRRRLPHWQMHGAVYWVTFRLADSIPQDKLCAWRDEREAWIKLHQERWTEEIWAEYDKHFGERMEKWLDAGMGSRALAHPDVRAAVKSCLLKFDGERLLVHSAVIMPTHVHCLIEILDKQDYGKPQTGMSAPLSLDPQTGMSAPPSQMLSKLLKGIKGASARETNKILGSSGTFWMDESYDHIVRNEKQYNHFLRYIAENPVKAGLGMDEYWLYETQTGMSAPPSLDSQTGMSAPPCSGDFEKRLDVFFSNPHSLLPFSEQEISAMDFALVNAKILDPACGSGAFPMGVLLKMVEILRILRKIPEDESVYDLKLQLIENCIYGSDIQCIAVQISKLRFFISLVCEQKPNDNADDNYGINSLPNLETKFVAANSLIGLPHTGEMLPMQNVEQLKKDLWGVRHKHFLARTYQEKKELRKEDSKLRKELAKELEHGGGFDTASAKLMAEWDPYDQNASSPFLDPEWMFNVRDGFDVVIGNPPYKILTKNNTDADYLNNLLHNYASIRTSSSKNLFVPFIDLGVTKLLSDKGTLSYIVPEGLFKTRSYEACKILLSELGAVDSIVMFSEYVFDNAVTGNLIFQYRHQLDLATKTFRFDANYRLHEVAERDDALLRKLEQNAVHLGDCATFFKGMVVKDRSKVLKASKNGNTPDAFLLGKSIAKWSIKSRFYTAYDDLEIIGGTKRREKHSHCPRILVRRTGDTLCCSFLEEAALTESTLYSCWASSPQVTNEFLLAMLNSNLMNFYNKKMFITNQQGFPQILLNDLKLLPVRIPGETSAYAKLVHQILTAKKSDPSADVSSLESEIDQLVYELYGLTPEEIAIVEESAGHKGGAGIPACEKGMKKQAGMPATPLRKKAARKRKTKLPPSLPGWE